MYHRLVLEDITFAFKAPSRKDLFEVDTKCNGISILIYEELIRRCVVEPKVSFKETPKKRKEGVCYIYTQPFLAGHVYQLGQEILDSAGLSSERFINKYINLAEDYCNSMIGKLDILATLSLPGVTPFMMWDCSPDELYRVHLMARYGAEIFGIPPDRILDPEAYAKRAKTQRLNEATRAKQLEAEAYMRQMTGIK